MTDGSVGHERQTSLLNNEWPKALSNIVLQGSVLRCKVGIVIRVFLV